MTDNTNKETSYKDAGVSIEKGDELVSRLKKIVNNNQKGAIGKLGGFGGLFDLSELGYKKPVLVSGTDGVGTKIKVAIENDVHETVGIDLVAMCVNDLIVQGAKPLFFLDYYACSKLNVDTAETVIKGIKTGCSIADCILIGGETAEMPGMYKPKDYDLAGFCVGVVEKEKMITGEDVIEDDVLIAVGSDGFHSNGYSLIRKILKDTKADLSQVIDEKKLLDHLLTPTRIYTKTILDLIQKIEIKSIAHITGGGIIENIPRTMPKNMSVTIDTGTWNMPPIFNWLSEQGNINQNEMEAFTNDIIQYYRDEVGIPTEEYKKLYEDISYDHPFIYIYVLYLIRLFELNVKPNEKKLKVSLSKSEKNSIDEFSNHTMRNFKILKERRQYGIACEFMGLFDTGLEDMNILEETRNNWREHVKDTPYWKDLDEEDDFEYDEQTKECQELSVLKSTEKKMEEILERFIPRNDII
mgnify:CR=1 FL=1